MTSVGRLTLVGSKAVAIASWYKELIGIKEL